MAKKHRFDARNFLVRPESKVNLAKHSTEPGKEFADRSAASEALAADVESLRSAQERLYAGDRFSVLVILQGMDASGKDGAIGHVMSGVNPLGCRAYAFKAPNETEVKHHFLWRPMQYLPQRGMMSIFNRSYYEEVLAVRVHPQFLEPQRIPDLKINKPKQLSKLWKQRYREINAFERSLVANGTLVIKFFLNVSKAEQKSRLLERMENPDKHWKFNPRDLEERALWPEYQAAYEESLAETSTEWAPWYIVPADEKWYARAVIADLITARLDELDLQFPGVTEQQKTLYQELAKKLREEQA